MKKTTRLKPLHFFAPITRVNEEERIVEGYVFANEVVDGEGGIRLKRAAMEAATPDYLRWGAVREMHQPNAAGTATAPGCGIEWDARGAFLRAKIVDDQAWEKVKAGVYKGFSLGVLPRLMRGKDVEACTWVENSLVDRPKDPGAVITTFRAEGIDFDQAVEVELLDDPAPELSPSPAEWTRLQSLHGELTRRVDTLTGETETLTRRAETAEAELVAVRRTLSAAEERVRTLLAAPAPAAPVRFPQALSREFLVNRQAGQEAEITALRSELQRLQSELTTEPDEGKKRAGIIRLNVVRQELAGRGVAA